MADNRTINLKNLKINSVKTNDAPLNYDLIAENIGNQLYNFFRKDIGIADILFFEKDKELVIFIRLTNNNVTMRELGLNGLIKIIELNILSIESINKTTLLSEIKKLENFRIVGSPKFN